MAYEIPVKGLDHVVLRVIDIDRMVAFYRDVLSCPVEKVQEDLGLWQLRAGDALIDFAPVDGKIGKAGGDPPGDEALNMDHLCLLVDPWDEKAIRAQLDAHGVNAGETADRYGATGYGPSIYLDDPEGNVVELKGPTVSDRKSAGSA